MIGLVSEGIDVLRLESSGCLKSVQKLYEVHDAKDMVKSRNGLLFAASNSTLWCVQMKAISFNCYNCGKADDHYSKNCPVLQQQYERCPECKNVAKTPAGHKITCNNVRFISKKIGDYELPFMELHTIKLTFKNLEQIYVAEETNTGVENFSIVKWFSTGSNIQICRTYQNLDEITIEIKLKPAITLGLSRLNESHMASIMFCTNQIRVNHYQHIDSEGSVSYGLSSQPRKDDKHDLELKLDSNADVIFFSLRWNDAWTANMAMNSAALTIGPKN